MFRRRVIGSCAAVALVAAPVFVTHAQAAARGAACVLTGSATISPGLTQTNFPKNMLERKSKLQVDHMRGMTPEQVADATLRAIERGVREVTFTGRGKLFVLASRFFPRVVDRIAARRVRQLYVDESAPD